MNHVWKNQSLKDRKKFVFERKDGKYDFHITLDTEFTMTGIKSLRVCELCGQESVNGKLPKDSCDEAQARKVMES